MPETLTAPPSSIDLSKFCAVSFFGKYDLRLPFVVDGWKYATNNIICIRVAAPGEPNTPATENEIPPVADAFSVTPACHSPWPTGPMIRLLDVCRQCSGRGAVFCHTCDERVCDCLMCRGMKKLMQDMGRRIGRHFISPDNVRCISELPNVHWSDESDKFLCFTFDGGEGRVMPRPEQAAREIEERALVEQ